MTTRKSLPKLCKHRGSGQGYVTDPRIKREVYLGPWGAAETVEAYRRWCREYVASGVTAAGAAPAPRGRLRLADLCERHGSFAEREYLKAGVETSEVRGFRMAYRAVLAVSAVGAFAEDFGTADFKRAREALVANGRSRSTVNGVMARVRRVWAWAVEEELLPAACWHALLSVRRARKGRGGQERPPVAPVAWDVVQATLPRLSEVQRAVVLLGWHGAMRPGEVTRMVRAEVDASREPWLYLPASWKTDGCEGLRRREVYLGPRAREVLGPWLERCRDAGAFVFPGRFPGTHLLAHSVADAIRLACLEEPTITHWSANRLRHAQATEIRRAYGLEAAQVVLGHARADVTQVYAERDRKLAEEAMEALG